MKNSWLVPFLLCSSLHAQNKISVSANPGTSLYNSENHMKTIGDKSVGWFPGISIAYDKEKLWGLNLHFEYNYSHSRVDDVLEFVRTLSSGPEPIDWYYADLDLSVHSLDLAVYSRLNRWVSIAIGPTVSLMNRSLEINGLPYSDGSRQDFADRLTSVDAGLNTYVNVQIPFSDGPEYPFFFSTLKARYLESVWFDKRGRNLDHYHQSLLIGQWYLGFGYNF